MYNQSTRLRAPYEVPQYNFDEEKILDQLKHYLPSQAPIKNFGHHNPLHAFQHLKFYEGIFKASRIFGYQVTLELDDYRKLYDSGRIRNEILDQVIIDRKGIQNLHRWKVNMHHKQYEPNLQPRIGRLRARWKTDYKFDLDNRVQPLLFRVIASYLDQGIASWKFPSHPAGFLASLRQLEINSYSSLFKSKRVKELLINDDFDLKSLLTILVGNERHYEQYLFDQQFSHPGWSGMVSAIEKAPHALLDKRKITLYDFIAFELLLEIDVLDSQFGKHWRPLSEASNEDPIALFEDILISEFQEILILWQSAFEWTYYDEVLGGIALTKKDEIAAATSPSFQAIFCIDEREGSFRSHLENIDEQCETLGSPGFFGVEFYYQQAGSKFYDKLCPAPVSPEYLIKETNATAITKQEILYSSQSHSLIAGTVKTLTLGFFACYRLVQNLFRPRMSPAIANAFGHMDKGSTLIVENQHINLRENNLQVGFTIEEMETRVENLLRGIGLIKNFAPLIYVIGHGSSSANDPHHSAHDCGACSGKPGAINARVFAIMANHPKVRTKLQERGIEIPETTQFVGGIHDTAADQIEFFDDEQLSSANKKPHRMNMLSFEAALDLNAKERSRRFASIDAKTNSKKLRRDILERSVSLFEPRPELGHGTNALCVVGRRELSKSLFLDRRAFLNSYDYRTDPDGKLLAGVMRPIGLVCGGINLEYYFSRVDNQRLGAGTKLPHDLIGLIGVANSSDGDLRPGLPLQMIEVHDPVRLLVIVEHFPDIVLKTIQSSPEIYEWYVNEWVHLVAVHPGNNQFYYFKNGQFHFYAPLTKALPAIDDMQSFIESAERMESNYIVDATKENLPVHSIN